ncbi:MAG TPA: GPR endopeptidase [Bacillota bacterium]|jgi:spore protease|nr:GPR endopeptidase [Bacillota bacterium]HOL08791.1 GPR endopeptidase [Bacillota bacterium]HPO96881.1 GPR endopeptidase [Bacillota bacterium]
MEEYLELLGEIHTDLALESRELAMQRGAGKEPDGVKTETQQMGDTVITRVIIETEEAGRSVGKVPGNYVTLEAPGLRSRDRDKQEEIALLVAKEIENFIARLKIPDESPCLVIGLGNWEATPDALGPKVVQHILVTRHLNHLTPPEKKDGLRPVSAIAPGVLGTTGIETGEIVMGVVQRTRPGFIVVIDALASRSTTRVGSAIQIADAGIHPGSGLGNKRIGITPQTMGIPVIAIGVPTVVEAGTIIHDAVVEIVKRDPSLVHPKAVNERAIIERVLSPYMSSLIVTPKEIDVMIEDLSKVVSGALNIALHPAISPDEVFRYLN